MRSAAQMVSYEIAMGFALVGVLMAGAEHEPVRDRRARQDGAYGASSTGSGCRCFRCSWSTSSRGVAETNRAPFDVAEGESEIVAGFHVEYSGMTFAVFFLAEYANMILISTLCRAHVLRRLAVAVPASLAASVAGRRPASAGCSSRSSSSCSLFLWFRATFPRYRYDQIMRLGWKVFIPVTLVWIVVVGAWMQTPLWIWWRTAHDHRVARFLPHLPAVRAASRA